jgi:hypothetical protein
VNQGSPALARTKGDAVSVDPAFNPHVCGVVLLNDTGTVQPQGNALYPGGRFGPHACTS